MSASTRFAYYGLGGITALAAASGAVSLAITLVTARSFSELNNANGPYTEYFFVAFSLINLAFLILLAVAAVRLLKTNPGGVRLLAMILRCELVYWVLLCALWLMPRPVGLSAAGATGIGNMGFWPQIFIAYPVTGLIAIWALRRFGVLEVEPGAPPNGGPTMPPDNSGVTGGPPSVS